MINSRDFIEKMNFEDDEGSQENTEPLMRDSGIGSQEQDDQSQSQSQTHYWGRLYPLKASLTVIDLVQNSIRVGKGIDCDVVLRNKELPKEVFRKVSKDHFTIQRRPGLHVGSSITKVFLVDKSTNGTYVNGRYLHRDAKTGSLKRRDLKSNDIIGFPSGNRAQYDAYLFIDTLVLPTTTVPKSVKNKYEITRRLGLGAFGEVSLVFDKNKGVPYAMKTIVKNLNVKKKVHDDNKGKLLKELEILQAVTHVNVIKLVDFLDCKKEHFLILEFMEGQDLSVRIQKHEKFDEDLAKFYMYQIANGVKYLHSVKITHRDLKPANLLLFSSEKETLLKITDFGLSKVVSSATMMKTLCGTKLFVAPEVLIGGGMHEYTEQVDVWSMGVIMYLCLSGTEPFSSSSEESVENLIKEAIFTMPYNLWHPVSGNAKSLIEKMLTREPEERITSNEILEDPWFQDHLMLGKMKKLYESLENRTTEYPEVTTMQVNSTSSCSMDTMSQGESSIISHSMSPPSKRFRPNN